MSESLLQQALIYMAAAVIAVPLFKRLGLGAILGYLCAGVAIGPSGLKLTGEDVDGVRHFSELGVVLLLFIIGLELKPTRLWAMRKPVFGLGTAQVVLTGSLLAAAGYGFGLSLPTCIIGGLGLSLSSTAFALQMLAEKNQLTTHHGRSAFAILLLQDLAVIPLLALIPFLVDGPRLASEHAGLDALKVFLALAFVVASSRYLVRPLFRVVAATHSHEVFLASALLVVLCTAALMEAVGLSMALGAFLAGVLLADSEYRHELEADIEPFKGLFLGLFFIAVGMSVNLGLLLREPLLILVLTLGVMLGKGVVLYGLARIFRHDRSAARNLAFTLPQGGEFAFVLFSVAVAQGVMDPVWADRLIVVVSLSMALMPLLFAFNERYLERWLAPASTRAYDVPPDEENPVIIAGFGRVGQIVGRVLRTQRIPFTALESDQDQVDFVRRFGNRVYYGDATRLELLRAARADKAKILVVALGGLENSVKVVETAKKHFPQLKVYARARNRQHVYRLMDAGADYFIRETFLSSLEMARHVLTGLDYSLSDSKGIVQKFRDFDERLMQEAHAFANDEQRLIAYARKANEELEELFEKDVAQAGATPPRV